MGSTLDIKKLKEQVKQSALNVVKNDFDVSDFVLLGRQIESLLRVRYHFALKVIHDEKISEALTVAFLEFAQRGGFEGLRLEETKTISENGMLKEVFSFSLEKDLFKD